MAFIAPASAAVGGEGGMSETVIFTDQMTEYTAIYNEYEMMEALAQESPKNLMEKGYTANEIDSIKNYKTAFEEHIEELNVRYTDAELLHAGYTNEEIKIIHEFKNLSPALRNAWSSQLAANLTLNLSAKNPLSYTNGVNKITLNYKFDWTRIPMMKFTDKFGLSWSNANFIIDTSVHPNGIVPIQMNYIFVPYTSNITASLHGNGIMYNIPMSLGNGAHTGDNAEGNLTLRYNGTKTNELAVQLDYAHAKLPTGISVSLPAGVVGFSFTPSSVTDCIWKYVIFSQ